jgi:hypothetical protein
MRISICPRSLVLAAAVLAGDVSAALAADASSASGNNEPTFGNRTDKPDGSAALTIGRRLPTPWETRIGTDVSLAAPSGTAASDRLLRSPEQSTGAVWGNVTMPGVRPLGFDKTSLEARLDAGKDEGRLGATLSRSVPLNPGLAVTVQNSATIRQSLATATPPLPPLMGAAPSTVPPPGAWAMDDTVRLSINPFGTTFSAGAASSSSDGQWRNKLSIEQTVAGPLKLTTSVEDTGTASPNKSISAGFKKTW